jgi:hypothetical protein
MMSHYAALDPTLDYFVVYLKATEANEQDVKALPLTFPVSIALCNLYIENNTLVAKFTFQTPPGIYAMNTLSLAQRHHIIQGHLAHNNYTFHPMSFIDVANIPTLWVPMSISVLALVISASLLLWVFIKLEKETSQAIRNSMVVNSGALLINLVYASISLMPTSTVTCSLRHGLTAIHVAFVQRYYTLYTSTTT